MAYDYLQTHSRREMIERERERDELADELVWEIKVLFAGFSTYHKGGVPQRRQSRERQALAESYWSTACKTVGGKV